MRAISKKHARAGEVLWWMKDKGYLTRDRVDSLYNEPTKAYKFLEEKGYRYSTINGWSTY